MEPTTLKRTKINLAWVLAIYLALMGTKALFVQTEKTVGFILWLQEIGLDIAALYLLLPFLSSRSQSLFGKAPLDRRAYQLLTGSMIATITSSTTYQVLSRIFGWTLPKAMGTPIELVINIPYMAFFLFGLLALVRGLIKGPRPSRILFTVILSLGLLGVTALLFSSPLSATGFPLQNQVLHWVCFTLECAVVAVACMNILERSRKLRYVSLGYASIAISGYLFQITEIYKGVSFLDFPVDTSWTLGQLLLVLGLSFKQSRAPQTA